MERICERCSARFLQPVGPGRPRLRCYECSPSKLPVTRAPRSCKQCAEVFVPRSGHAQYCGPECRAAVRASRRKEPARCADCRTPVTPSSSSAVVPRCRPCRSALVQHGDLAMYGRGCRCKPCRAAQARSLREYWASRPRVERTCVHCGEFFLTRADKSPRFCSLSCANRARRKVPSQDLVHVGPVVRPVRSTVAPVTIVRGTEWWTGFISGACAWCGDVFMAATSSFAEKYCSRACSRSAAKARRGTKFVVAPAVRLRIYERDGWCCQICGESTSREWSTGDPWAPTLDHIVPQAAGGSHDEANLRLAHAWCNSVRGDLSYYTDEDLQGVA